MVKDNVQTFTELQGNSIAYKNYFFCGFWQIFGSRICQLNPDLDSVL